MGGGLGLFLGLLLLAWLEESFDAYSNMTLVLNETLSTNYIERVIPELIRSRCPWCEALTSSLYCKACKVYYCLLCHRGEHKECAMGSLKFKNEEEFEKWVDRSQVKVLSPQILPPVLKRKVVFQSEAKRYGLTPGTARRKEFPFELMTVSLVGAFLLLWLGVVLWT